MSASNHQTSKQGSGYRHPPELRERAVRMLLQSVRPENRPETVEVE